LKRINGVWASMVNYKLSRKQDLLNLESDELQGYDICLDGGSYLLEKNLDFISNDGFYISQDMFDKMIRKYEEETLSGDNENDLSDLD
jgi:hypothetical protein